MLLFNLFYFIENNQCVSKREVRFSLGPFKWLCLILLMKPNSIVTPFVPWSQSKVVTFLIEK
jgi:hypothetical protein